MILCPPTTFKQELISLLRESVLNISKENIEELYSIWSENFENYNPNNRFILEKDCISNEQHVPENTSLLGIDLPIWFNSQAAGRPNIMLLGIDPLRNKRTFKEYNANEDNQVIIGTPYALHDNKMRCGRTKNYWEFIENLSENNFVYVTDFYKTFFLVNNIPAVRSYDFYKGSNVYSKNLLQKEIEIVNPDLIITLGAESYQNLLGLTRKPKMTKKIVLETLDKFNNTTKVIPMVHLSGSTRAQSKINFIEINNFELEENNFGKAYFKIINQFL